MVVRRKIYELEGVFYMTITCARWFGLHSVFRF